MSETSETALNVNPRRRNDPRKSRQRNVHQLFNRKLLTIDSSTARGEAMNLLVPLWSNSENTPRLTAIPEAPTTRNLISVAEDRKRIHQQLTTNSKISDNPSFD